MLAANTARARDIFQRRPSVLPLGVPQKREARAAKVLLYSHDTFGLGNIRRTLLLCHEVRDQFPDAAILIVTGSPMIHAFRIPERTDYVKLPCLDRADADEYVPRFLAEWPTEVRQTRKAILHKTTLGFDPDLLIVDKRAAGVGGELLDTIRALRRRRRTTKLALGMRDILDDPERAWRSLRRTNCFETIARYYDEVWIFGEQAIFDPVKEYAFPPAVAKKTHFCGYLKRPTLTVPRRDRVPRVLVTPGGGGDGAEVIEAYLEGLAGWRPALRTTVVFGPQIPASRRTALLARFGHSRDVTFIDFEADLSGLYAEADVVVSMAGYNTVCELLSFGCRAVLVPRAEPVREQLIRARLFAAAGRFELVEPNKLTPQALISKVLACLESRPASARPVDLQGLPRARDRMRALLEGALT